MMENKPVRDTIREIIDEANCRHDSQTWGQFKDYIADNTIAHFKTLIDGLTVIDDSEIMEALQKAPHIRVIAEAQLAHDIKELKSKCRMD